MGSRVGSTLRGVVCVLLVGIVGLSGMGGCGRLERSFGMDQSSPTPTVQVWIATAGVGATVVLLIAWTVVTWPEGLVAGILVAALALVLCSAPLWRRDNTIDVESSGFHRGRYGFEVRDFGLYNATDQPIRVCLGKAGVCGAGPGGAPQLRAPGLTIGPGETAAIRWPSRAIGKFTLTVADPPAVGSRRDAVLTLDKHADPPSNTGYQPPPYQPPPYQPPPVQPPLR